MDAPATYSGKSTIISSKYSRGIEVTLPSPGFPDSNYSVNVTPIAFENSSPFISIYDGIRFWIGGNPGDYLWTATNQNGSNGGAGSTGPNCGSTTGGGGGAGGYRTGTTPIGAHPVSTTIQIGAGGLQTSSPTVTNGTPSYFGTPITSAGGGGGAGVGSGAGAGAASASKVSSLRSLIFVGHSLLRSLIF